MPFERVNAITFAVDEDYPYASIIDPTGEFVYFGCATSPGRVVKIRLSDFSRVGALTFEAGENNLYSAVIDAAGAFAYFGCQTSPARVVKIRLSDFSRVGAITFEADENSTYCSVLDNLRNKAYFGAATVVASPSHIVKVDLATFTREGRLTDPFADANYTAAVIDDTNTEAYFLLGSPTEFIAVIDLATFSLVCESGFDTMGRPRCGIYNPADLKTYWGSDGSPHNVWSVIRCIETSTTKLFTGENDAYCAILDTLRNKAYFGHQTTPGKVVEVNLNNFTKERTLEFLPSEDWINTAVIDPMARFAYFACDTSPGIIVKVALDVPSKPCHLMLQGVD